MVPEAVFDSDFQSVELPVLPSGDDERPTVPYRLGDFCTRFHCENCHGVLRDTGRRFGKMKEHLGNTFECCPQVVFLFPRGPRKAKSPGDAYPLSPLPSCR